MYRNRSCDGRQTVAVVNDDNRTDILILHYERNQTLIHNLSDLTTTTTGGKIVKMVFGCDPNTLYVVHEKGNIAEIQIDKQSVNPINFDATLQCPSMFADQHSSVYLYSKTEIQKVDFENNTTTTCVKRNKPLFCKGTTTIDPDGNIHSLIRKPFCSDHSVAVCTQNGDELRSYGEGLLFYGDSLAVGRNGYSVAGEGDCVHVFHTNGQLFKTIKGFGFVSSLDINDDILLVTDSWNKRVLLMKLTMPPPTLYEQCIRQTIPHLNDYTTMLSSIPTRFQKLLEDWNFCVRVEIWTTKELEIAFTEVYRNNEAPVRRDRTESRAVITNSKSFFLKLKLGIEFNTVRKIISARLKRSGDIDLYTRRHTVPNKLPESGILKQEHNKIAAIYVS